MTLRSTENKIKELVVDNIEEPQDKQKMLPNHLDRSDFLPQKDATHAWLEAIQPMAVDFPDA